MIQAKTFEKLRILPPGSVTAKGWLRDQLLRCKDGMGGHLDELEPAMIGTPFHNRKIREDVGKDTTAGWNSEQSGYFWYGFIQLAFALDDAQLKAKAEKWVNGVLANQREDGYLGTYTDNDNIMDDFNAWGTSHGMNALQAYCDATGREDIITAIHRCLLWFCDNWPKDKKSRYCGQAIAINMSWCYGHTGDERLVEFINDYFDFLNRNDICDNSINSMLSPKLIYNSFHAVGLATLPKVAAMGYRAAGHEEYREAAVNLVRKIKDKLLLPTGGLSSNTEYLSPIASNTETEYCTFSVLQNSLIWLGAVTGDAQYFDITERISLNGAQGARKKDEKAIAYFTSPNQIFATSQSDFMGDDMGVYAPCYSTACCPTTSVWVVPDYLYGMALTDSDGNAYVTSYGPARLDFGFVTLETDTMYPFRDTVGFTVHADAPADKIINLRIPSWCENATVKINGKAIDNTPVPGKYLPLKGTWKNGDKIELYMPMSVSVTRLNDNDSWRHHPLVVEYGPLVFSLPIPEEWRIIKGHPRTPLPDGWHWYEVEPKPVKGLPGDVFERPCLRKYSITWNVAVDESIDTSSIKVCEHDDGGYVWENPPLSLTLPGYKALYCYAPYARKTHEVYQAPIDVQEELTLTLVPYGSTALRITCFPRANTNSINQ